MPFSTVFIATCSEALGDFISPLGLASCTPAGKKQLLHFGQDLGGKWKMTTEREKKEQFGQSAEIGAERGQRRLH